MVFQKRKEDFQKAYELAYKLKEKSFTTHEMFRTSVFQFTLYYGTQLYNEIVQFMRCFPIIFLLGEKVYYAVGKHLKIHFEKWGEFEYYYKV